MTEATSTTLTKREQISRELNDLFKEGTKIALDLVKDDEQQFQRDYQRWYTKSLKVVQVLAPDRYTEFRGYYEVDPKRKSLGYGTYVIQDFVRNVIPSAHTHPGFNARSQVSTCLINQLTILNSLVSRIDSVLANIEGELYSDMQDSEVLVARQLLKVSIRAAGALMGVVIEGHLQKVAVAHGVKISKRNPTIADLTEPLKAAAILDTAAWRKVSYLADLRNLCSHRKDVEPSKAQVEELIDGTDWLVKNVF